MAEIPVLRLAGAEDWIVWQGGWDDTRFQTPNVLTRVVQGAGHFPWVENAEEVRAAFKDLAGRIASVR